MSRKEIIVWISLDNQNIRVGKLWCHFGKNRESASFEYDKKWLNHPKNFELEPNLKLTEGVFHTKTGTSLFGAIGDSAPDRWGRVLMRRVEALRAKKNNIMPTTLLEIDYLLRVNDEARQGALRFSVLPDDEIFLRPQDKMAIPPLIYLPKLLSVAEHFIEDNESGEELKLLLAAGASLGGARPKVSILDQDGSLAIAKFPRKDDEFNVVLWEAVALTLAEKAGIRVPNWRLEVVLEKPVLIIKRFDRNKNSRIPFISAMSMLDAKDNEEHSYLEIAYALAQYSAAPDDDMIELWRRIIFTVMISNVDDHLRNHGFLYDSCKGWRLSPAYDMNPTPLQIKAPILATSIGLDDASASLEIAMSVCNEFRVPVEKAYTIIKEVGEAVSQWSQVASRLGLSRRECDRMASAFEYTRL